MELSDLAGEHILDAVDSDNEQVKTYGEAFESCSVLRFRLDGIVYTAIEDPDDGYRSCLRDIVAGDHPMTNCFEPLRVVGMHRTRSDGGYNADILALIDVVTGKIVIEVGTDNSDDYYPSFVGNFNPENMAINQVRP